MCTGGQDKQTSVLTLMEKYMCLQDIHKVYFQSSKYEQEKKSSTVAKCSPLLCRIEFKTSHLKYHHESLPAWPCRQVESGGGIFLNYHFNHSDAT